MLDDGSPLLARLRQWCIQQGIAVDAAKSPQAFAALSARPDVAALLVPAAALCGEDALRLADLRGTDHVATLIAVATTLDEGRAALAAGATEVLWVPDGVPAEQDFVALEHALARAGRTLVMQRRLRQLEMRLQLAQAGSEDALWEWDVPADRLDLTPQWWALLGFDEPLVREGAIEEWYSRVHPADLGRLRRVIGDFVHREPDEGYIREVVRMLRKDGFWTWVRVRAVAERDDHGVAVRLLGTIESLRNEGAWDWLTGLPNRQLFEEQVAKATADLPEGQAAAVIYLGIDRLSEINESLGHAEGDRALRAIAARIETALRPGDVVGRFSGDEFAICLTRVKDAGYARTFARDLLLSITQPLSSEGQPYRVTASAGLALFAGAANGKVAPPVDEARAAMYAAKTAGGGQLVEYEAGMKESRRKAITLREDLERALREEEFELWYQPIYRLGRRRRLAGFEALIRWVPSREQGLYRSRDIIGPAHFIPFAEATGLIVDIGAWVICTALRQAREWAGSAGIAALPVISVNLSARQFQDERLVDLVRNELSRSGVPPALLRFELTETMLVQDMRVSLARMQALRDLGVSLALDDFGTGYSSLAYLYRYPVSSLKVDQSLVRGIDVAPEKRKIVRTITMLARELQLDVVAEGIENRGHLRVVRKLGCAYGQGMLLGRPASAEAAGNLIRTQPLDPRSAPRL